MSTKRMSRTLIEGGATNYWKEQRVIEQRRERRLIKQALREGAEEMDFMILPVRDSVWGMKSNHATWKIELWLKGQIGRKWDDVWSDLCRRYNRRTERGRRILQYVKHIVCLSPNHQDYGDFIVDWDGILYAAKDFKIERGTVKGPRAVDYEMPSTWPKHSPCNGPRNQHSWQPSSPAYAIKRAGKIYWVEPINWISEWVEGEGGECKLIYHPTDYDIARQFTEAETAQMEARNSWGSPKLYCANRRLQRAQVAREWLNKKRETEGMDPLPDIRLLGKTLFDDGLL
jgi:hypothetical protein